MPRSAAERTFNALDQWRGRASRYEKHGFTEQGGVVLAEVLAWLGT